MANLEVVDTQTDEDRSSSIWLPQPEGYRTAQIHWMFLHDATAVDGDPLEVATDIDNAKAKNQGIKFVDPTFGQPLYFTAECIRQVAWVGVIWIPHEQIQASAQRAKEQEQKQREAEAKAGFLGQNHRRHRRN